MSYNIIWLSNIIRDHGTCARLHSFIWRRPLFPWHDICGAKDPSATIQLWAVQKRCSRGQTCHMQCWINIPPTLLDTMNWLRCALNIYDCIKKIEDAVGVLSVHQYNEQRWGQVMLRLNNYLYSFDPTFPQCMRKQEIHASVLLVQLWIFRGPKFH